MGTSVETRTYARDESVVFCKTAEAFGGLSNMAPGFPLRVNGIDIRTSEALYQACRFPHLPDVQRLIIDQKSPMTAKMKSKPYRSRSREDWDVVRVRIMRWCLRVKLVWNWTNLRDLLVATGERSIVEESRKDDFWGRRCGATASWLAQTSLVVFSWNCERNFEGFLRLVPDCGTAGRQGLPALWRFDSCRRSGRWTCGRAGPLHDDGDEPPREASP